MVVWFKNFKYPNKNLIAQFNEKRVGKYLMSHKLTKMLKKCLDVPSI